MLRDKRERDAEVVPGPLLTVRDQPVCPKGDIGPLNQVVVTLELPEPVQKRFRRDRRTFFLDLKVPPCVLVRAHRLRLLTI